MLQQGIATPDKFAALYERARIASPTLQIHMTRDTAPDWAYDLSIPLHDRIAQWKAGGQPAIMAATSYVVVNGYTVVFFDAGYMPLTRCCYAIYGEAPDDIMPHSDPLVVEHIPMSRKDLDAFKVALPSDEPGTKPSLLVAIPADPNDGNFRVPTWYCKTEGDR